MSQMNLVPKIYVTIQPDKDGVAKKSGLPGATALTAQHANTSEPSGFIWKNNDDAELCLPN